MIERLQNHLVNELQNCNKKESTYVILSVVLFILEFIILLIVSETMPSSDQYETFLFVTTIVVSFVINAILILVIYLNDKTRNRINNSLFAIYHDNELDKYFTEIPNFLSRKSSLLPMIIVITLTVAILLVPFVSFIINTPAVSSCSGI